MKIKCKQCDDIIENKVINKEIWCSCKCVGLLMAIFYMEIKTN